MLAEGHSQVPEIVLGHQSRPTQNSHSRESQDWSKEMQQPKLSWDCVPSKGGLMDGFCPEGLQESQIDSSLAVLPPFWVYTQNQ